MDTLFEQSYQKVEQTKTDFIRSLTFDIHRYLCPSISNYEIVTGIHNMCYFNIDSL